MLHPQIKSEPEVDQPSYCSVVYSSHCRSSLTYLRLWLGLRELWKGEALRHLGVAKRHRRRRFDPWVRKSSWRREWQPTPVFLPGESQGQWSLAGTVHRVAKSQNRLKQLSMHACMHATQPLEKCIFMQVFNYMEHALSKEAQLKTREIEEATDQGTEQQHLLILK